MVDGRHLAKHPDENLLTAFAERSLTPKERQSVTEHLSTCARCRDVVFVAQQASLETADQSERSSVADTVGRRLWWESLGVAGILAALLIAVPIVVYRHRSHPIQSGREQIASENRLATPTAESGPSSDSMSAVQTRPAEQASKKAVKRASSAAAIKGRAEIIGSVADRTGAAIPGAHVTVRGASSGNTRTVLTNPQGQFDVASLPSGSYQVEVQAPGFNTFSQPVTVQPSERASLDAKLDVGAATQTVSVTASKGGVAAGIIGGLATSSSPTGGPMIRNRDTASVPPSGRNITPAAAPATPTLTPQAPVAAQLHPVTTGPLASGMVANGAALTATFAVKDGAVQRCIGTECAARILPLGARAVSSAASGQTVMALDSDGNVFLSSDQGEHWNQAKVQWLGKAIGLRIALPAQAGMFMAQPKDAFAARASHGTVAGNSTPVHAPPGAMFELTNNKGQVWVSSDEGKTWTAK